MAAILDQNHETARCAGTLQAPRIFAFSATAALDETYESHRIADWELKWRELRIRAGVPPAGSSPAEQQKLGLNRD